MLWPDWGRRTAVTEGYTWPCSTRPGSPARGPAFWPDTSTARPAGHRAQVGPARSARPCLGRQLSPWASTARHGVLEEARQRPEREAAQLANGSPHAATPDPTYKRRPMRRPPPGLPSVLASRTPARNLTLIPNFPFAHSHPITISHRAALKRSGQ